MFLSSPRGMPQLSSHRKRSNYWATTLGNNNSLKAPTNGKCPRSLEEVGWDWVGLICFLLNKEIIWVFYGKRFRISSYRKYIDIRKYKRITALPKKKISQWQSLRPPSHNRPSPLSTSSNYESYESSAAGSFHIARPNLVEVPLYTRVYRLGLKPISRDSVRRDRYSGVGNL